MSAENPSRDLNQMVDAWIALADDYPRGQRAQKRLRHAYGRNAFDGMSKESQVELATRGLEVEDIRDSALALIEDRYPYRHSRRISHLVTVRPELLPEIVCAMIVRMDSLMKENVFIAKSAHGDLQRYGRIIGLVGPDIVDRLRQIPSPPLQDRRDRRGRVHLRSAVVCAALAVIPGEDAEKELLKFLGDSNAVGHAVIGLYRRGWYQLLGARMHRRAQGGVLAVLQDLARLEARESEPYVKDHKGRLLRWAENSRLDPRLRLAAVQLIARHFGSEEAIPGAKKLLPCASYFKDGCLVADFVNVRAMQAVVTAPLRMGHLELIQDALNLINPVRLQRWILPEATMEQLGDGAHARDELRISPVAYVKMDEDVKSRLVHIVDEYLATEGESLSSRTERAAVQALLRLNAIEQVRALYFRAPEDMRNVIFAELKRRPHMLTEFEACILDAIERGSNECLGTLVSSIGVPEVKFLLLDPRILTMVAFLQANYHPSSSHCDPFGAALSKDPTFVLEWARRIRATPEVLRLVKDVSRLLMTLKGFEGRAREILSKL